MKLGAVSLADQRMLEVIRRLFFILIFAIPVDAAWARDDESIKALRDTIVALAPDVDPAEAERVSVTAHTTSRSLAREYRMVRPPDFQNFLIHIGLRQRGFCFHWARDIGARLKELKLKTLVLHWGAAFAGTERENNCLVLTARGQPLRDGIVIDGWRKAGRLWWSPVIKDKRNPWVEDMGETTWLQNYGPNSRKSKRTTAQR
jgi:hypothetical protein